MDGIFGVGVAEVILIGLVLFIIGGPENTAKWARELGRWVRKAREAWSDAMAQLEKELGDDGKDIVDAAREVGQEFREVRRMTSGRSLFDTAMKSETASKKTRATEAADSTAATDNSSPATETDATATGNGADTTAKSEVENVYPAWLPPDESRD